MKPVCITSVGAIEPVISDWIQRELRDALALPTARRQGIAAPASAWDAARRQYNSPLILAELLDGRPNNALRVVALTELDLYIPMLSFVYGQAQLDGIAAIVSLARLRQEFYGLPQDRELLFERALKEVLHELGHTFGLVHCSGPGCVMALATNIRQVDLKGSGFCAGCGALMSEAIRRAKGERVR